METVKGYVLMDEDGAVVSRPFGSKEAALKASKYKRFEGLLFTVREIDLEYKIVEPEKPEVNHGRIT